MPDIKELTRLALAGDLNALQELRDRGILKTSQESSVTEKEVTYPLSHAQRRLWILSQFDGTVAYNLPGALLLEGILDQEAAERTFAELVRRHESLRTVFVADDEEPRQKIGDGKTFHLCFTDLTRESRPEDRAEELAHEDAITPFDLEKGPLIRGSVLKIAEDRNMMIFNMHHIISDGWSMGVLVREFCSLYRAFSRGEKSPLPRLRIQYKDYAAWQNQFLESEKIEPHRDYWLGKLSGKMPVLNLPGDFTRPSVQTFNGDRFSFILPPKRNEELRMFAQKKGMSLFMLLLATVKVLLYRYTGQEDLIVGIPIAGRNHADIEDQIGFYINTLALRDQIQGETTFDDFLQQIRETTTEAYSHQDYPFDKLVEDLDLPRDLSRSPLFDVMVVLQNMEPMEFPLENLTVRPLDLKHPVSQFDLLLEFMEGENGLQCNIRYNTDIFIEDRIRRMTNHFQTLADSILTHAKQPVRSLNILPEAEQNQILYEFNDTAADYPRDKTIVDLFEEQAEKTPDNVAVIFEDTRLTYRELNEYANQVAHFLRDEYHVQPDDRVGLFLERSEWMIVGVFGILKAGGAYVPVDPNYPEERIRYIVSNSECSVLLTEEKFMEKAASLDVSGMTDLRKIREARKDNPPPVITSRNLAYVIYTSGSTGQPKGVMIEHHSVLNRILWMHKRYPLAESGVILQKTPFTFDVSVWELFWWSFVGAPVCMLKPGGEKDPAEIVNAIEDYRITAMHFVPSMFNAFLSYLEEENCSHRLASLTDVFASGEALPPNQVRRFNSSVYERHGTRLHNLYGPTEATVDVSYFECSPFEGDIVPIGKPVDNTFLYILDMNDSPVPIGIPGELCIAGVNVGRGYLSKPELTKEKFVADPFRPGERMYRTGDLCRWLTDGNIEYLGRNDFQVKIRGFRIELGEIENALESHPEVRQSVVLVRDDPAQDKRLIAYLVPVNREKALLIPELRDFLRKKLPDYMVPAVFVMLEKMPLNPSGKANRKALPEPDRISPESEAAYVAPRDETEAAVAEIWKDLLNLERVGVYDKFFDIGGHSLLVIRMQRKLGKQFDREILVPDLFRYTTVAMLSEYLRQEQTPAKPDTEMIHERSRKRKTAMRQHQQKRNQRRIR